MASKNARHKRKSCKRKIRYETIEEAKEAIRKKYDKSSSMFKWKYNVYPCQYCGGFHIGHRPKEHAFK